jgi:iron complex outermembrane receptor protein
VNVFKSTISAVALAAALPAAPVAAHAAEAGSASGLMEEVVVTARKKTVAENTQTVPLAVSAFGAEQLAVKHVRDLAGLGYGLPNVSMDAGGTFKATANFSIRGLGINASIPTLEPSVGVFVDGMYLGINAGVLMDVFDLEQIEVLRGPQGLLFGKNVTGGAVLVSTKRPSKTFEANAKFGVETGPNWTASGSVSGPVNEVVRAKLAAYFNKDEGYFRNSFNNKEYGKQKTYLIRPAIEFQPTDALNLILRGEYGKQDGDGAAAQNHAFFSRHSFDFSQNVPAYNHSRWIQVIGQVDLDVGFGDGKITNITGYRHFKQGARVDTDATPNDVSDSFTYTDQEQYSNELRYAGTFFERLDVTTGVYYFTQQINYQDNRRGNGGAVNVYSGGIQDSDTYAWYSALDFKVKDTFTINAGLRYSYEKKKVRVATQPLNQIARNLAVAPDIIPASACDIMARRCNFDFVDQNSWKGWVPKVGFQWKPVDDTQIYGFWTKGFRGGGYNVRSGSPTIPPGPFEDEVSNSFELGNKSQFFDRRLRFNNAVFYNKIKNLQRSIILPDPQFNTVTLIRNSADATIWGVESDIQFLVAPSFVVFASAGYTHGKYDEIKFDLTGDRLITTRDLALKLPRLSPWTGSVGFNYDHQLPNFGMLAISADYSYRDKSYYNDSNTGYLNKMLVLNGNITLTPESGPWAVSVYGKNLLNQTQFGGVTPALSPPGASFAPLEKGRIVGVEAKLEY